MNKSPHFITISKELTEKRDREVEDLQLGSNLALEKKEPQET